MIEALRSEKLSSVTNAIASALPPKPSGKQVPPYPVNTEFKGRIPAVTK